MQAKFLLRREYQDNFSYSESFSDSLVNFHSPIEIWVILEGSLECWINGQRRVLHEGDLAVAFSYDTHGRRILKKNTRLGTLVIPVELCGEFQTILRQKRICDPYIHDREAYERITGCIAALQKNENEMTRRGYLYVILGTLLDRLSLEDRQDQLDPSLSTRILCYLNENFREELSLRSVAEALGYHPAYLSHYFTEVFHTSFSRYVTMLRLRESVLLMQEEKSLSECAFESGFGSLRTFHRAFQEEFQCTPKNYMKQLK